MRKGLSRKQWALVGLLLVFNLARVVGQGDASGPFATLGVGIATILMVWIPVMLIRTGRTARDRYRAKAPGTDS